MRGKVILIHPDTELRSKMLESLRHRGVLADAFSSPQEARAQTQVVGTQADSEMTVILASFSRDARALFVMIDCLMDGDEGIESEYVR